MLLPRFLNDDIFISYSRKDGGLYATGLADQLTQKNYSCYIDKLETEPGQEIPTSLTEKLRRCAVCVVIGTAGAAESEPVAAEITEFRKTKRTILLIDFNGAVGRARWYSLIRGLPVEQEKRPDALETGDPSANVVNYVDKSFKYRRRNQRLARALWISLTVFLLLVATSGVAFYVAQDQLAKADAAKADADRQSKRAENATQLAERRAKEAADATKLARDKTQEAQKQAALAEQATAEARRQQQIAAELSLRSSMLRYRVAAQEQLSDDPVLAYKLAAEAYKIAPDAANRKLILSALSQIDLYDHQRLAGYSIEDFKDPLILLVRGGTEQRAVFDTRSATLRGTTISGSTAWIVPLGDHWRILTESWIGSGSDAIATYRLWDSAGKPLSDAIPRGGLSHVRFLTDTSVSFPLHDSGDILVWNLATNERRLLKRSRADDVDTYFYDIYGALDTRADGVSAAHYKDGLVLIGADGALQANSYTPAGFDPAFSSAQWSADGQYLALAYHERERLGIWNPSARTFVWLDPDRWVAESYAWSLDGHVLAFSGRSVNNVDVTVEVVDAARPESRRVIHRGAVPVRRLAFLPEDRQVAATDRDRNLFVIDIDVGAVIRQGYQRSVDRLFSNRKAFYSSNSKEFRVWSVDPAPATHWSFNSSKSRTYRANGAADPNWTWLAVSYSEGKETAGLELRRVSTGERLTLSAPTEYSMNLQFSDDGKWLAFETTDTVRIYDTRSWKYFDFGLREQDRQFITLRMEGQNMYLHALGADYMNDTSNQWDYVIALRGDAPVFVKRVHHDDKASHRSRASTAEIEGWRSGTLYQYQASGLIEVKNASWVYSVKCRDQALGASDCDVQFIPKDLNRLMALYDKLLWTPSRGQLASFAQLDSVPNRLPPPD